MKDLHFMRLWDLYNPLLTETQREITNLYFNCDLSLSEIAEEKGCSRQSISDCLNKCRKQLEEYEEKLHFCRAIVEVSMTQSFLMTDVGRWAEKAQITPEQRAELNAIVLHDYTEEVREAIEKNADTLL